MPLGSTSKPRLCWTNKVHVTKKITDRIPSILDEISVWRWFSRKKSIQNRFSQFESTHNSTKLLTSMRSDVFTRRSMLRDWIFHGTKVARRRLASYQPPKHQYQVLRRLALWFKRWRLFPYWNMAHDVVVWFLHWFWFPWEAFGRFFFENGGYWTTSWFEDEISSSGYISQFDGWVNKLHLQLNAVNH